MIRALITILIMVITFGLYAQDPFYIIEDFGHIQAKANCIIEYDNHLYIVGSAFPQSDSIHEQDLHLCKYDLSGGLISNMLFRHDVPNGVFNFTDDQSVSIWKDQLLISHFIGANDYDAITVADSALANIEFLDTIRYSDGIGIGAVSHVLTDNEKLIFTVGNSENLNLICSYDLKEGVYSFFDLSSELDVHSFSSRVMCFADIIFFVSGVQYLNDEEKIIRDTKLIVLNKELQVQEEHYLSQGLGGAETRIHAILNEEQNQLVVTVEDKKDQKTRPVIYAVDLDNYELVWQEFHGDSTYKRRFDFPRSLIRTHDKLGYLTAGLKFADPDLGGPFIALLTKMDAEGKTIWQKSISDLHEGTGLMFDDVLATSDGYYVACGSRSDVTEDDGYDSRVQLFMIKFDEDGNIVDRDAVSSTLEEDDKRVQTDIRVYPNPTSGILYIENLSNTSLSYQLVDDAGHRIRTLKQDVTTELAVLDLSGYPSGSYVLVGTDNVGEVVVSERVVMVR